MVTRDTNQKPLIQHKRNQSETVIEISRNLIEQLKLRIKNKISLE